MTVRDNEIERDIQASERDGSVDWRSEEGVLTNVQRTQVLSRRR